MTDVVIFFLVWIGMNLLGMFYALIIEPRLPKKPEPKHDVQRYRKEW